MKSINDMSSKEQKEFWRSFRKSERIYGGLVCTVAAFGYLLALGNFVNELGKVMSYNGLINDVRTKADINGDGYVDQLEMTELYRGIGREVSNRILLRYPDDVSRQEALNYLNDNHNL
jgi:hypothetical protein